jgi:hypothetical protein
VNDFFIATTPVTQSFSQFARRLSRRVAAKLLKTCRIRIDYLDYAQFKLAELERMADFTRWGEAAAQGTGWAPGTFVKAYRANRQAVNSVIMEDSPLAQALLSLAKYHGPWKGTLTQLLALIAGYTGYCSLTTPGWPKTPAIASAELRRIAPQLQMFGLSVTFERTLKAGRIVTFTPIDSSGRARAHAG